MSAPEAKQPGTAGAGATQDQASEKRPLTPEAERALAEAAARRARPDPNDQPKESGGRGGLEPTRYGDWEINGIASDF